MIPKRILIIGSGYTIRQNLWHLKIEDLPIWKAIKDEFKISLNWSYKWSNPDIAMCGDFQFYETERENLKKLSIVLSSMQGHYRKEDTKSVEENTYLLPECQGKYRVEKNEVRAYYWKKEGWIKGIYCSQLTGLQAISFAILIGCTEIYLLGFDATGDEKDRTHFYQDDNKTGIYKWNNQVHTGIGKTEKGHYRTSNYEKIEELNNFWFKPFEQELKNGIQIYNVSSKSKIDTFPKISYEEFYQKLKDNPIKVNHEETQKELKEIFKMHNLFTRSSK